MREEFLKYFYAAAISEELSKSPDLEEALKELGYQMGKHLIVAYDFKPETKLEVLLYKMTHILFAAIHESKRCVERSTSSENTYIMFEHSPLFARHISPRKGMEDFCGDAVFCGIIERILIASGYESEVTAQNAPLASLPDRVAYIIVVKGRRF